MKALVTGAAGFIGSHLCQRLLAEHWDVVGIDNFNTFYDPAVKRSNIAECLGNRCFELAEADIRNSLAVEDVFQGAGFDVIVHLAAMAGVRPSIENPHEYYDVNVNGTVVLLESARKSGVAGVVFASSSSVYGNNFKVPFAETDNVDFPISPYAASKKAGELICHTYSHLYNMNISCLRLFTVYGPRQRPDLAIHKFAALIEADRPIPVYGDGSMSRDYTYIDDIIDGIISAVDNCRGYQIFNLGGSRPVRLDILISELEQVLGKKAEIEQLPEQPGDVKRTWADITRAAEILGYEPKTSLRAGLIKFTDWLKSR